MTFPKVFTGPLDQVRGEVIECLKENNYYDIKDRQFDLDNEIHFLLRPEKFIDIKPEVYEKMAPALRLASLLITDKRVLGWFFEFTRGSLSSDRVGGRQFLGVSGQIPAEEQSLEAWEDTLRLLDDTVSWETYPNEKPEDMPPAETHLYPEKREAFVNKAGGHDTWRAAYDSLETLDQDLRVRNGVIIPSATGDIHSNDGKIYPCVLLHGFFYQYFDSLPPNASDLSCKETIVYLSVQFFVANLLVHELCHCVYNFPKIRCISEDGRVDVEVYTNYHEAEVATFKPEAGVSWALNVIGGHLDFALSGINDEEYYFRMANGELMMIPAFAMRFVRPRMPANEPAGMLIDSGGTNYRLTSHHGQALLELIRPEWIARWFRKTHWAPEKMSTQITEQPTFGELMLRVPHKDDKAAQDKKIVRATLMTPPNEGA